MVETPFLTLHVSRLSTGNPRHAGSEYTSPLARAGGPFGSQLSNQLPGDFRRMRCEPGSQSRNMDDSMTEFFGKGNSICELFHSRRG